MRKLAIALAVLFGLSVIDIGAAFAGGQFGGHNNANPSNYRCKSGKMVKQPRACKENGGRF